MINGGREVNQEAMWILVKTSFEIKVRFFVFVFDCTKMSVTHS